MLRFVNNDFQENKEPTIGGMFDLLQSDFLKPKDRSDILKRRLLTFASPHYSRLFDSEMPTTYADYQIRDLGYGRPRTLRLAGANVLSQCTSSVGSI